MRSATVELLTGGQRCALRFISGHYWFHVIGNSPILGIFFLWSATVILAPLLLLFSPSSVADGFLHRP